MNQVINIYTSAGVDQGVHGFAAALSMNLCRPVQVLPVSQLPAPDPLRLQALQVEKAELEADLPHLERALAKFTQGEWTWDASRENGLKADIDATKTRLRAIEAMLSVGKGGLHNG